MRKLEFLIRRNGDFNLLLLCQFHFFDYVHLVHQPLFLYPDLGLTPFHNKSFQFKKSSITLASFQSLDISSPTFCRCSSIPFNSCEHSASSLSIPNSSSFCFAISLSHALRVVLIRMCNFSYSNLSSLSEHSLIVPSYVSGVILRTLPNIEANSSHKALAMQSINGPYDIYL